MDVTVHANTLVKLEKVGVSFTLIGKYSTVRWGTLATIAVEGVRETDGRYLIGGKRFCRGPMYDLIPDPRVSAAGPIPSWPAEE